MTRTLRIPTIAVLVALVVGAAGCGARGKPEAIDDPRSTTTSTSQPATDPPATEEDEVVWQEYTGGGFAPVDLAGAEVPDVTIYADGRIFVKVGDPLGRAGGPVALEQDKVPAQDLAAFLDDAAASGLFDPGTDFGSPGVTDQTSTNVTLRTDEPPQQINVYALDFGSPEDPNPGMISEEQATRRADLRAMLARARALGADGTPYLPQRVRAVMFDPDAVAHPPTTGPAWPGPAFDEFPPPADGGVQSCLVIEGGDAEAVYRADQDNPETTWELGGEVRTIVISPLLPGQEGCPPS